MLRWHLLVASGAAVFRGGSALLFLLILARVWGVEAFGQFAYAFTAANVLGLFVDYGFQIKLLRDLSLGTEGVARIIGRMLAVKVLFVTLGLGVLALLALTDTNKWVPYDTIPLFIAYAFNSISMCLYAPFKVQGMYGPDARMALIDGLLVLTLAFGSGPIGLGITDVAWLLVSIKTVLMAVAIMEYRFAFPLHFPRGSEVRAELVGGTVFAGHAIIGALYLNADTFVVRAFTDSFSFGVYQSGMRVVIGAGVLLTIVNAVFTPRFGKYVATARSVLDRELRYANAVVFLMIAGGCLILWRFGESLSVLLYGEGFESLGDLLWIFGAVVGLRISGSFYGVVLSLEGRQTARMLLGLGALVMIVITDIAVVPEYGIHAAALVLLFAHVFILVAYVLIYRAQRFRQGASDA